MATQTVRRVIDFTVENYTSTAPKITVISNNVPEENRRKPLEHVKGKSCTLRCYASLQGEDAPFASGTAQASSGDSVDKDGQIVCRYDWAFGISLLEGFYWNWRDELPEQGAVAVHLILQPQDAHRGVEPIPTSALLSVLQPSRNTKSLWEQFIPASKAGAELAKSGASLVPTLNLVASGLNAGSDLLASYTGNRKNWFLYQFIDQDLKCPVVEWRINREVFLEYGSFLRGTLFMAVRRSPGTPASSFRILLRPQIRYHPRDELKYIVPTRDLPREEQVSLDVFVA